MICLILLPLHMKGLLSIQIIYLSFRRPKLKQSIQLEMNCSFILAYQIEWKDFCVMVKVKSFVTNKLTKKILHLPELLQSGGIKIHSQVYIIRFNLTDCLIHRICNNKSIYVIMDNTLLNVRDLPNMTKPYKVEIWSYKT